MTIICEIGQSHCGDMRKARDLIYCAKKSGADLVKFQLYDHRTLYPDNPNDYSLSYQQALELFLFGSGAGIEVFFSVFDVERIDWCEQIKVKRYKIAYRERKNMPLKMEVWGTHKEVIMSTNSRFEAGGDKLLYCVPDYPARIQDVDFEAIIDMDGFSDHTIGLDAPKIALARGAEIIEKHFALSHDKETDGPDAEWSMTPSECIELKRWHDLVKEVL